MDTSALAKAAAIAVGAAYIDAKHYVSSDLLKAKGLVTVSARLKRNNAADRNSMWYFFESAHDRLKKADAYVCEGHRWSWEDVMSDSLRIAHFLISKGAKRGDKLALLMSNRPAYPIIWIACLMIDVVPAFINYSLTGNGLSHCVKASGAKFLLYEAELEGSVEEILPGLPVPKVLAIRWVDIFTPSETARSSTIPGALTLDAGTIAQQSNAPLDHATWRSGIGWQSPACLIYTSGSTGLPKAATVTHGRSSSAFIMWTTLNRFTAKDRIYTPMPLYHATAALLAVGTSWNSGATVIIGRKFSATKFWTDVRTQDATVIQYVGEVLRYLLGVPPSPQDKDHRVRLAYGNGCRPDVWNKFRDRFGIPVIAEFFASTEGNGSAFNYSANNFSTGAVGHEGTLASFARRNQQTLVLVDPYTEDPVRDAKGFCVRAPPNEDGELICVIDQTSPFKAFAGYHGNDAATEKKILRNVFKKGDMFFRTGDLLKKDTEGFTYFSDRMGDTFRWKGENVATTQVSEALGAVVDESNVYGILLPGHEGRAGCAAIPATSKLDLQQLATHVQKSLPKFAWPLFLRIVPKMESTGTGKQMKVAFRNEGVDPRKVKDTLYWMQGGKYIPFNLADWNAISAGKVKL